MQNSDKFDIEMVVQFDADELTWLMKMVTAGAITAFTLHAVYKLYDHMQLHHEKGRSRWKEFLAAVGAISPLAPTALASAPLSLPLESKLALNYNVSRFRFRLPQPDQVLGLQPGQHVSLAAEVGGKRVVRSYSPVSGDELRGHFDVVIKRYDGPHALSKHIHAMKEGDRIEMNGPRGHIHYHGRGQFTIGKGSKQAQRTFYHLSAVAGGSGLTPLLQIIQSSLDDDSNCCNLTLLFANSTEKDVFMREELDALAEAHSSRFHITYTVSKPGDGWKGTVGRPDSEAALKCLPPPAADHAVMLCGPNPMVKAVVDALKKAGHEERNLLIF